MKKIIIALLVIVALAAAGFGIYSKMDSGKISMEGVLPADPVFYVRANNISQRIDRFAQTKFWHDLKAIDYTKLTSRMGVPGDPAEFEKKMSEIFSPENQEILKALFGKEVAIAVYADGNSKNINPSTPAEAQKLFLEMASNVTIATRVGPDVKAAEFIAKLGGQFSKDISMNTTQYKGKAINLITNKDGSLTFGYVRLNDFVIMGIGEKAAQHAIDVVTKSQKSLNESESFIKRKKSFGDDPDTVGFFEMQVFYQFMQDQIQNLAKSGGKGSAAYQSQMEDQFKQTQGIEAIVFANKSGDILTGKADLYYDAAKLNPEVRSFYTCSPNANNTAKFVPWDAIFYNWVSCMDFTAMWQSYKSQLEAKTKMYGQKVDTNAMINTYEQMLGLKIDSDILPALGKEFGIYLTDLDTSGNLPVPKMVVFVQTTGRAKGEAIINKLLALQPMLKTQEEQYNGETIKFIPIPLASSFKVSYAFIGDYMLLATNVDVLKASLDAAKNPDKSISINSAFSMAGISANGPYNSLFFAQIDRATQKVSALMDWSKMMAKQSAEQSKAFLAGSKKNLEDIKTKEKNQEQEVKNLQAKIAQVPVQPDGVIFPDDAAMAANLKKQLEATQKELAANKDKEKELTAMIAQFEARAPRLEDDQAVTDQFIKPLLGALSNLKFFMTTTINHDGVFASSSYLKLE